MEETFKFPNGGYDVKIVRKEEILRCIENNIKDKDVALELIKHCEIDATNFLLEGRWASIPFIGNIRIPKTRILANSEEHKTLVTDAREILEPTKYVLFRKKLASEIDAKVREERLLNYRTSQAVKKNFKFFSNCNKNRGEHYAKFLLSTFYEMECVSNSNQFNNDYYNDVDDE